MFLSQVIGNLGFDVELKDGDNGSKYAVFSLAHNELSKDNQGNPIEKAVWISVMWYNPSEKLIAHMTKGTKVFVSGRTKSTVYLDKNGAAQLGITIYANVVELCGVKSANAGE